MDILKSWNDVKFSQILFMHLWWLYDFLHYSSNVIYWIYWLIWSVHFYCFFFCVCVYYLHMWRSEGNLWYLVPSFYYVSPRDWAVVVRLVGKCIYLLSHPTSPNMYVLVHPYAPGINSTWSWCIILLLWS